MADRDPSPTEASSRDDGDRKDESSPGIPSQEKIDPIDGTTVTPESSPHPAARTDDATVLSQRTPVPIDPPLPLRMSDIGNALVGKELKHFRLESFIGGGGMGAVFKATDNQLERPVAVKILTHRFGQDDDTVRRFKVEAQSAARLNHENIAAVYYVGEDKGWNFIVFEYIQGENLRDLVARTGPIPIGQAVTLIIQIAEALDHANQRDVVHRDIKPSNILLTPEGRSKLVDMGLARLQQVETSEDDLTVSGVTLGTFDYISPEQGRDPRNADVRSDLYSLGCTFFYMLTGKPPYPNGTALQKLLSHTSDPPPDARDYRTDLPDEIAQTVLKLLAKKPEQRYQSPMELIADLMRSSSRLGLAVTAPKNIATLPAPASDSLIRRTIPWLVPVLVLAAAVLVMDRFDRQSVAATNKLPEFRLPDNATMRGPASLDPSTKSTGLESQESNPSRDEQPGVRLPEVESDRDSATSPPEPNSDTPASIAALATQSSGESAPLANVSKSAVIGESKRQLAIGKSREFSDPLKPWPIYVIPGSDTIIDNQSLTVGSLAEALDYQSGDDTNILIAANELTMEPMTIDKSITIRPAPGYRPTIRFQSFQNESRSCWVVDSANLIVEGIGFELDTRQPGLNGLFSIKGAQVVQLTDCSIRVLGESREESPTSVFHVTAPSMTNLLSDDIDGSALAVELRNCQVVGDTRLLSIAQALPLKFAWTNGLFASLKEMVYSGGSPEVSADGELIKLDLDHLTALAGQGLFRTVASKDLPHLITIDINATRSILATDRDSPLISSIGRQQYADELESLLYSGERNFYEGASYFWKKSLVSDGDATSTASTKNEVELSFAEWQRRDQTTDIRWQRNKVEWQRSIEDLVSFADLTADDFRLSDSPSNPALRAGGGVERSDAGFIYNQLPEPFWQESTE